MIKAIISKTEFPVKNMEPGWWKASDQSRQRKTYKDGRKVINDVWYVLKPGYPGVNAWYDYD